MGAPILGLSGSPREGGNTDIVVQRAVDAVAQKSGKDVNFIRVADFALGHCIGCRQCMTLGRCALEGDDLNEIMAYLFDAETIIIGSPVYWLSPPGVLKDFMDRSHGWYTDLSILAGKRAAVISVAADSGFEPHEEAIAAWLTCYGAEVVHKARIFAREKGEVLDRPDELRKLDTVVSALAG
ncbi:MAG: flavodoxin family protein [Armatimonadota bacterium]|nr:MAG: flavodoxin family protein [Armatimonadota bacterium]